MSARPLAIASASKADSQNTRIAGTMGLRQYRIDFFNQPVLFHRSSATKKLPSCIRFVRSQLPARDLDRSARCRFVSDSPRPPFFPLHLPHS